MVSETVPQIGLLNDFPVWRNRPYRLHKPKEFIRLEPGSPWVETLTSPRLPLDIQKDILIDLDPEVLHKFQAILTAQVLAPTQEMPSKFMAGLRWIGEATKPDKNQAKFLKVAFALESLIGGEANQDTLTTRGITAALSERAAFLAGKDPNDRRQIDKKVRAYYGKRSAIVHGGAADIQDIDLTEFASLVRRVAWALLSKIESFNSVEDLQHWVVGQRYS